MNERYADICERWTIDELLTANEVLDGLEKVALVQQRDAERARRKKD